jgi:dolichyl-phosphate-mannose--protein O-mannosyl transferase
MTIVLDTLYFLFRYIPFWAIPLLMISMQFGYIYWIKEVREASYVLYSFAAICGFFLIYYIYAGSPDNSARILDDAIRNF